MLKKSRGKDKFLEEGENIIFIHSKDDTDYDNCTDLDKYYNDCDNCPDVEGKFKHDKYFNYGNDSIRRSHVTYNNEI